MYWKIASFAVLIALVFGPVAARAQTSAAAAAGPAHPAGSDDNYKLGDGDKLHIIIFDEPQLTGDFTVGPDGLVSLPWIGGVPARDRTVGALRADIEARLRDGYIRNPTVSLQVDTYRPFYILGEVNKPGQYPYTNGLTVRGAVATAGGFTYRANTRMVFIKHQGESGEMRERITAESEVHAGDTIRIAERFF